jgi:hypothetical protein
MCKHKESRRFDAAGRNKAGESRMLKVINEAAAVDTHRITVSQAGQHGNDEHLERVDVPVATCKYGKLIGNSRKAKRN